MEGRKFYRGHVVLVPYPAQGHINPFVQFAKRLAAKGVKATLATTHYTVKSICAANVGVEPISDGFDQGGFAQAGNADLYVQGFRVNGSRTLSELIRKYDATDYPVDCVVYDSFLPWALDVAKHHGVYGAAFFTNSATVSSVFGAIHQGLVSLPLNPEDTPLLLPGLPPLNYKDLPTFITKHMHLYPAYLAVLQSQFTNVDRADCILVNSFEALEAEQVRAKLGKMVWARNMFDDMIERSQVSWTALICGYARSGDMNHARKLFEEMPEERDSVLYNAMIDGYVKLGDMSSARTLFDEMPDRNVISWTSMIYGYCNHGDVGSARSLFDAMPDKNLFSWNAMIGGYCQNKQPHEALTLFQNMQQRTSLQPDIVTLVSILPAIADLGALDLGEWVHSFARRKRLDRAINLCTALVDMYAKCGEITKARRVFDEMREKEIASWNAMINGYAVNGHGKEALEVFMDMQLEGVKPNDITMLAVLSACNHGGLVKEGKRWFEKMEEFGLTPKIEHYGCTIDLLGRAGYLDEAENLMRSMPYKANGIILSSFLSACGYSYDVTRAKTVLNKAINMEPYNDGNYVMLRNLYAAEKRWRDAEEIKGLMRRNGAKKEVGCSVIEVDCMVSEFVSGDRAHPQWDLIQLVLGQLWMHMKGKGFTQLEQD